MSHPIISKPQPGFYRTRLAKGACFVPARIWIDDTVPERPAMMLAEINGKPIDVWRAWTSLAGNEISREEFCHLTRVSEWAQTAPDAPEAQPRTAIDLATQPVFMPRSHT